MVFDSKVSMLSKEEAIAAKIWLKYIYIEE